MIRLAGLEIAFVILVCVSTGYGQETLSYRNAIGELINQDYFAAGQGADTTSLLLSVESYHVSKILPQLNDGNYEGALSDVKYTLNRFPNHPRGLALLGVYAKLTKAHSMAIPYYERAITLYPQYAVTRAQYGGYMVTIGHVDAGIKKLNEAIEMDSKLAFAYAWMAMAHYRSGNGDLAREANRRARELGYQGKIPGQEPGE